MCPAGVSNEGALSIDQSVAVRPSCNKFANVTVALAAENVFDEYPEEATNQANRRLIYSRNAPYVTDGGHDYLRLDTRF